MRWPYGLGIALLCVVGACMLPDLKSLSGGDGPDATASDGASTDGAGDGAAADGASLDGARPPCPDSSFCDDFDEGTLGSKWGTVEKVDGLLALEEGGLSVPNRLRMDLLAPTGGSRRAGMRKLFPISGGGMKRVVCTMSIRVDVRATGPGEDYQILSIAQRDGARTTIYVKVTATGIQLTEQRPNPDGGTTLSSSKYMTMAAGGIPTGLWTKLTLDANYVTKTATLTLVPEGSPSVQLSDSIYAGSNNKTLDVYLGESDDGDLSVSTTQFDDFRCDFTP